MRIRTEREKFSAQFPETLENRNVQLRTASAIQLVCLGVYFHSLPVGSQKSQNPVQHIAEFRIEDCSLLIIRIPHDIIVMAQNVEIRHCPDKAVKFFQIMAVCLPVIVRLVIVSEIRIMSVDKMKRGNDRIESVFRQHLANLRHALVLQPYLHTFQQLEVPERATLPVESEIFHLGIYCLLLGRNLEGKFGHSGRSIVVKMIREAYSAQPALKGNTDSIVDVHPGILREVRMRMIVEIPSFHHILSCA